MSAFSEHSLKLQLAARERNKVEDRKLTCNLKGKSGPEAVYKLNLEKVNHEQRLIARDLGRMKNTGRHNLAAPTSAPFAISLGTEERMIQRQLQTIRKGVHKHPGANALMTSDKKFHHPDFPLDFNNSIENHPSKVANEVNNPDKSKNKLNGELKYKKRSLNRNDSDIDGFMIMEYLDNINNTTERDKITRHSDVRPKLTVNQLSINQPIDIQLEENSADRRNEIDEIERSRANQIGSFLSDPNTTTGEGRFVSSGIELGSRRYLDLENSTKRQSLSGGAQRSTLNTEISDLRALPGDDRAFTDDEMSLLRGDVKTKGERKKSTPNGVLSDHKDTKAVDKTEHDHRIPDIGAQKQSEKRTSKVKEEMLVPAPDMLNADGTLKTMYALPAFEQRWEEAQKARYIRTNHPMERDRELNPKEIFDRRK